MIRPRIAVAVCIAALIGFTGVSASADSSVASPDSSVASADSSATSSVVSDFTELFTFVGSAPLAPAERERLARATEAETRAHPAQVQSADASLRKFLAVLTKDGPLQRGDLREALRLQFESLPDNDALRQIVDRTDPVIVFDKPHKRLITEGTLVAWRRAGDWMAGVLSVPRPGADFIATQRAFVKTRYAALPDKEQEVVAHVERNYPAMVAILDHADAAKRAQFITLARPQALDRSQFGIRLADAMAQFYDVALRQEFMNRLVENMAVLNNGLLLAPMYSNMTAHMGSENAATNAGMAAMGSAAH